MWKSSSDFFSPTNAYKEVCSNKYWVSKWVFSYWFIFMEMSFSFPNKFIFQGKAAASNCLLVSLFLSPAFMCLLTWFSVTRLVKNLGRRTLWKWVWYSWLVELFVHGNSFISHDSVFYSICPIGNWFCFRL